MPVVIGVDLSHYSDTVNYAAMRRDGVGFAWTKLTQGDGYVDPTGVRNVRGLRDAGILPGGYHFLTRDPAAAQLANFRTEVDAAGGPEGLLLAVDVETYPAGGKPVDPRYSDLTGFMRELRGWLPTHPVFCYSGAWFWDDPAHWSNPAGAALGLDLWDSRYVRGSSTWAALYATVPASWWAGRYGGWKRATVLQFSDAGRIGGEVGDVNAFLGTLAELAAYATSHGGDMARTLTQDDLDALHDVIVRATVGYKNLSVDPDRDVFDFVVRGNRATDRLEAAVAGIAAKVGGHDDPQAFATAVAPVLAPLLISDIDQHLTSLSDADVARLAKAAADETDRRERARLEQTP